MGGPHSVWLTGNYKMQHFPNLVDNGTVFSKSSKILLNSIVPVCFLKLVEVWLEILEKDKGKGKALRGPQTSPA